ncbi:MAG: DUF3179 domain-containing protein [Acidimicrobiales bacterium]
MAFPRFAVGVTIVALVGTACSAVSSPNEAASSRETASEIPTNLERSEPVRPNDSDAPYDLSGGATSGSDEASVRVGSFDDLSDRVAQLVRVWKTDWSRTTIDLDELIAGIPRPDPRDAIPPIDEPEFESPAAAAEWLEADEPGALVQLGGDARFYPLSIMTRHEIVNDRFGDVPVAVTFCPLCNTALAFDRRIDGEVIRLGVSGLLRNSDMVMWDDISTSLWQQITGEGIAGQFAGSQLDLINTQIVSFSQFAEAFPDGMSLSRNTGFQIGYGANPYAGYSSSTDPFLFDGDLDPRFPALERVVGVVTPGGNKAYPFSTLEADVVINDVVADQSVVVWWAPGTRDALDQRSIADSRAIGSAVALRRTLEDGTELTFTRSGEEATFVDTQTGSQWNLFGRAIAGELEGQQLPAISHRNEFWFAWAAFFPESPVYGK